MLCRTTSQQLNIDSAAAISSNADELRKLIINLPSLSDRNGSVSHQFLMHFDHLLTCIYAASGQFFWRPICYILWGHMDYQNLIHLKLNRKREGIEFGSG